MFLINSEVLQLVRGSFFRVVTLFSKFFILLLANNDGGMEAVGVLGLLLSLISVIPIISSFEFYQRLNRKASRSNISKLSFFHLINFAFSLSVSLFIGLLAIAIVIPELTYFLKILVLLSILGELIYIEVNRFEYAIGKYDSATLNNFSKSFGVALLSTIIVFSTNIDYICCYLLANTLITCYLSVRQLKKYFPNKVDFRQILIACKKGYYLKSLKSASSFIYTSIFFNLLDHGDKIIMKFLLSPKALGYYVVSMSIVSSIKSLIFFGPVAKFYPELLKNICEKAFVDASLVLKKISIYIFSMSFVSLLFLKYIIQFEVINILTDLKYIANYELFFIFLSVLTIAQSFSYVPHYQLYAAGLDANNAQVNFLVVLVFFFLVFSTSDLNLLLAIFYKVLAVLCGLFLKSYLYLKWRLAITNNQILA